MLNVSYSTEIILQVQTLGGDSLFAMQKFDMQETKIFEFFERFEAIFHIIWSTGSKTALVFM